MLRLGILTLVVKLWAPLCPPVQVGFFLLRYAQHFKTHLAQLVQLMESGKLQVCVHT